MFRLGCVVSLTLLTALPLFSLGAVPVSACDLPGTGHGDNKPSEKKGEKMIDNGASACEVAQKCDAMSISIDVEKDELHGTNLYQSASSDIKEKLDHAVKEGNGADGLYCYELEKIMD